MKIPVQAPEASREIFDGMITDLKRTLKKLEAIVYIPEVELPATEEVLNKRLHTTTLPPILVRTLNGHNLYCLGHLARLTDVNYKRTRGFGVGRIDQIKKVLKEHGLRVGMESLKDWKINPSFVFDKIQARQLVKFTQFDSVIGTLQSNGVQTIGRLINTTNDALLEMGFTPTSMQRIKDGLLYFGYDTSTERQIIALRLRNRL